VIVKPGSCAAELGGGWLVMSWEPRTQGRCCCGPSVGSRSCGATTAWRGIFPLLPQLLMHSTPNAHPCPEALSLAPRRWLPKLTGSLHSSMVLAVVVPPSTAADLCRIAAPRWSLARECSGWVLLVLCLPPGAHWSLMLTGTGSPAGPPWCICP